MTAPAPRAVIGVPLYNHARQLPQALDSLLAQRYRDFAVVLVDDCSTDETKAICDDYVTRDRRFQYHHNQRRLGYIGNTRRAFNLANELFPEAEYFAWGSDHDLWHPLWLQALIAALEAHPEAVLGWTLCQRIAEDGAILKRHVHRFETLGETDRLRRFTRTLRAMVSDRTSAGNMIYGLFRKRALMADKSMPAMVLPDRALILEAALRGQTLQVPELLWFRRYVGIASQNRQRRTLFPDRKPFYIRLPPWITHAGYFIVNFAIRDRGRPDISRLDGWRAGFAYMLHYPPVQIRHRLRQGVPKLRRWIGYRLVKPARLGWHRFGKKARRRVRTLAARLMKAGRSATPRRRGRLSE